MKLFTPVLLFLFYATMANAQTTAFISKDKLYPALKGFSARQASLDTLRLKLSQEIQEEEQTLQKKYESIINPYAPKQNETFESLRMRMNKTDAEKLKLLQDERKLHETRIKSYNNQISEQYSHEVKPYLEKAGQQIEAYAKKNKIDMIWYLEDVKPALPYYNSSKDITRIIAEEVNKMLP
ncbi:OmpH family outer membrane protein [Chryseobacterium hagamense]|uniref:Outer membrane protein n=1 Tax=Chryseobacterium hagamense TaxID=395935 RepID=A0A511YSC9_9FLAO|nr:OmpH family outer membrane protein [Chryseobacterium hagamense]GEN78092.1 hypothetical protein CHA01nite_38320 [Chryseobacterium hagamense]